MEHNDAKVLKCYSTGDPRFSAVAGKVMIKYPTEEGKPEEKFDRIDNHYYWAKQYIDDHGNFVSPADYRQGKEWQKAGRKPVRAKIYGIVLPLEYINMYYKLLWVKYFEQNPILVDIASQYDEFVDIYRSKESKNCQADVIRQYVKQGRQSIMDECKPLLQVLHGQFIRTMEGDLLECPEQMIGHQTNCLGTMGAGLADLLSKKYPILFPEYELLCRIGQKTRSLMGYCQDVSVGENKWVCNLFGQHGVGTDKVQTETDMLRKAMEHMKRIAFGKGLTVALPYQIGCNLAGGNWDEVYKIIQEVFSNYPVTIYRLSDKKMKSFHSRKR